MDFALWLDASLPGLSVAILSRSSSSDWKILREHHEDQLGATANINSILNHLLAQAGIEPQSISYLLVGVGPGSFTGIKVALAWAYGFFVGRPQIKICGLSALKLVGLGLNLVDSQILLKVTANHGFLASFAENYSEVAFERVSVENYLRTKSVYLANTWPEVFEDLKVLDFVPCQIERVRNHALNGLISLINSDQFKWDSEFPEPRYLKQSTAEEKFMQQKENRNG